MRENLENTMLARGDTETEENSIRPAPENGTASPDTASPPPPQPSAFGAPSQQQQPFGPWDPSCQPPRFASFTSPRYVHGGVWNPQGSIWNMQGEVPMRARPMVSFSAARPSQEALLYRYPSCPPVPPSGLSFSGYHPYVQPFQPMPSQHPPGYMHSAPMFSGTQSHGGRGSTKKLPSLVKVANILSLLVLLLSVPVGIWYSYYMYISSSILMAGPISAAMALGAIHFTKCCCTELEGKVKFFKICILTAGLVALAGSVIIPAVMFGLTCPDDEMDNCDYDKPHGEGFSVALAIVLFIHGIVCVIMRLKFMSIIVGSGASGGALNDGKLSGYEILPYRPPEVTGRSLSFGSPAMNYNRDMHRLQSWQPL